jgi:hypothetical protein
MGLDSPSDEYKRVFVDDFDRAADPNAVPVYVLFMEVQDVYAVTIDSSNGNIISVCACLLCSRWLTVLSDACLSPPPD